MRVQNQRFHPPLSIFYPLWLRLRRAVPLWLIRISFGFLTSDFGFSLIRVYPCSSVVKIMAFIFDAEFGREIIFEQARILCNLLPSTTQERV